MAEPQASRFWMAAQQSGLLNAQSLTACWDAIPLEKRDAVEHLDRRLARQAVQQNFLTLWQAQQLLAGRTSGFRVDRYLLLELIGQGGMGRVYLARDTRLKRLVALKILAPERMNNSRAVDRFKREARVGAQLQHENLVRIYDFGQANGRFFLVMEYIEGKTVGALITAQGPMPVPTAARFTWQIALGLEHAHRKGLIHRDVNPNNVLVTHEGIAKLADLGLAIDLAEAERVTREGATIGTFDYVAPERRGTLMRPISAATSTRWVAPSITWLPGKYRFPARAWRRSCLPTKPWSRRRSISSSPILPRTSSKSSSG